MDPFHRTITALMVGYLGLRWKSGSKLSSKTGLTPDSEIGL